MTRTLSHITIEKGMIRKDGIPVFGEEHQAGDFAGFAKAAYEALGMKYPKFFKMDAMCKLALLGAEGVLTEEVKLEAGYNIALLFANQSSSLDTDIRHQNSIQDPGQFYPGPAIFVYTLPNIAIGEVSIRHQLQTESMFLIQEVYDRESLKRQAEYLIIHQKSKMALIAWVEYMQGSYKLEMELLGAL